MSTFTLTIETNGAAFSDPSELARILRDLARDMDGYGDVRDSGKLRDINGNAVGEWINEARDTSHVRIASTFGTNTVCERCGLLPLDQDDTDSECEGEA